MAAETRLGLPLEAANTLSRLLSAPDLGPEDALSAAETLFSAGQWRHAVRAYRACLRLRPEDESAAMGLAATLHRAGHPRAAEAVLRRLISRAPGNVQALSYLGHLCFDSEDHKEAGRLWESIPLERHVDPRALRRLMMLRWGRKPLEGLTFLDIRRRIPILSEERRPEVNREVDKLVSAEEPGLAGPDAVVVCAPFESIEALRRVLRSERLIDGRGRWSGGKRSLIVLGRLFASGKEALRPFIILALLHQQAQAAGGHVAVVTGERDSFLAYMLTWGISMPMMEHNLKPELEHFVLRWHERGRRRGGDYHPWTRLARLAESAYGGMIESEARVGGVLIRLEPLSPAQSRERFGGQSAAAWAHEADEVWGRYLTLDEYCSDAFSADWSGSDAKEQESAAQRRGNGRPAAKHETDGPWRAWQVYRLREPGAFAYDKDGLLAGIGPLCGPLLRYLRVRSGHWTLGCLPYRAENP